MKKQFLFLIVLAAFGAEAAMTAKTAVTQRWPWSTAADIDFTLSGGEKCDVAVTASFKTNGVPVTIDLEHFGLVGDTWELEPGAYHLAWDPAAAGFDVGELKDFSVTVTPVENAATGARKWLVLDLVDGSWEYYADEPEGGWTNRTTNLYRGRKMVFRRIPAGTFQMGVTKAESDYLHANVGVGAVPENVSRAIPRHAVTLTHDYYIAIFKTTAEQYGHVLGESWTDGDFTPVIYVKSFYALRGERSAEFGWPEKGFAVTSDSLFAKARARFNNRFMIDLPTSAQWEKAARAETTTFWPQGGTTDSSYAACSNIVAQVTYSWFNDPECPAYYRTDVGLCAANAYGLYDCVGMRTEHVLDLVLPVEKNDTYAAAEAYMLRPDQSVDPVGAPYSATSRLLNRSNTPEPYRATLRRFCVSTYSVTDHTYGSGAISTWRFAIHLRPPRSFGGRWQ